jgi:hypothetical protein
MNRTEFQRLAETRLREAEALLAAGLWDGAYYLAGYAIECALKACILRRVEQEGVIFDEQLRNFQKDCWTHDLERLSILAAVDTVLAADRKANPALEVNWSTVAVWNEQKRYKRHVEATARALVEAINHPMNGVLTWIQRHW